MHSRWCAHGMALMVYGLEQWYPPHGVQGAARGGGTWGGDHKRVEGEVCMCVWPRGLQFIFHAIFISCFKFITLPGKSAWPEKLK
jgi:hypothetical protein